MSHTSAAAKTPFIDWESLGRVAGVSFVFAIGLVALFSVGLVGLSWARAGADDTGPAAEGLPITPGSPVARPLGAALAGVCFLVCAAGVLYGLYLIIPQFHT